MYGLEVVIGVGAGSYTQAAFAVIQAVVVPAEANNGLALMLLGKCYVEMRLHLIVLRY